MSYACSPPVEGWPQAGVVFTKKFKDTKDHPAVSPHPSTGGEPDRVQREARPPVRINDPCRMKE